MPDDGPAFRLQARKSLGQHFLFDPGICRRIVAQAGDLTSRNVVEIGPGPGGLTKALLETGLETLVAVELDGRAVAVLNGSLAADNRLTVVHANALNLDLAHLIGTPRHVVANLPYNVGTPLLLGLLRQAACWEQMTLMFQQEVAARLVAKPDTEAYGRLSVLAQWLCVVELRMRLAPGAFVPPPKVWSAVVVLRPKASQPAAVLLRSMEVLTAAAFGQRRKMLRSSLKPLGGTALLEQANIDPQRRGETLDVATFERLARLLV